MGMCADLCPSRDPMASSKAVGVPDWRSLSFSASFPRDVTFKVTSGRSFACLPANPRWTQTHQGELFSLHFFPFSLEFWFSESHSRLERACQLNCVSGLWQDLSNYGEQHVGRSREPGFKFRERSERAVRPSLPTGFLRPSIATAFVRPFRFARQTLPPSRSSMSRWIQMRSVDRLQM